jgi:ATP/maltotriose-dependent transcriptional regulator MalT
MTTPEKVDQRSTSLTWRTLQSPCRTKVHRPPVTHDLVSRPYLLKQLSRGLDRNLTLVSAPVGFGKMTG